LILGQKEKFLKFGLKKATLYTKTRSLEAKSSSEFALSTDFWIRST